jgi:hypothetical protein
MAFTTPKFRPPARCRRRLTCSASLPGSREGNPRRAFNLPTGSVQQNRSANRWTSTAFTLLLSLLVALPSEGRLRTGRRSCGWAICIRRYPNARRDAIDIEHPGRILEAFDRMTREATQSIEAR